MKKIFLLFILGLFLMLSSCTNTNTSTYVKNFITSYKEYDKAYVIKPETKEEYLLTDEECEIVEYVLKSIYESKAVEREIAVSTSLYYSCDYNSKSDMVSLTKPTLRPHEGTLELIILNSNTENYITFLYYLDKNISDVPSLIISDGKNNVGCEVEAEEADVITNFGYCIASIINNNFYEELAFVDAFPIITSLNSENVSMIEKINSPSGLPPMSFKTHEYYETPEIINNYLRYLESSRLSLVTSDYVMVPGGISSKVVIHTANNVEYELDFYEGYFEQRNNYYQLISDNKFVGDYNRITYSFDMDEVSGELYKHYDRVGNYTLDLSNIRLEYCCEELVFTHSYEFNTPWGTLYIGDEQHIAFADTVYHVVEGSTEILKLIGYANLDKISYIEEPKIISREVMKKFLYIGLDDGIVRTRVFPLNDYITTTGESLFELFELPYTMTDEYIKDNYAIISIVRSGPIDDDFENVAITDLFVESSNLYLTVNYNCESTGIYDSAVGTYFDYILVPISFANQLKYNFKTNFNNKYKDGIEHILLEYEKIEDIKKTYRLSEYGPDEAVEYEVFITATYGTYNGAIVLMMTNSRTDYGDALTYDMVAGYTFTYYSTNKMIVYYENKMYTLPDAYLKGILTSGDLTIIYNLYQVE